MIYAALAVLYMLLPIVVIALFSFNDRRGTFNFTWSGFTLEYWRDAFAIVGLNDALITSLQLAAVSTLGRDDRSAR